MGGEIKDKGINMVINSILTYMHRPILLIIS